MKLSRGPTDYVLLLQNSLVLWVLLGQGRNIQSKMSEMMHGPSICSRCIRCASPPTAALAALQSGSNPSTCGPGTGHADRNRNAAYIRFRQPNHRHHTTNQPKIHSLDIVPSPMAGILAACTSSSPPTYLEKLCAGLTFFGMGLIPMRDHKKLRGVVVICLNSIDRR